MKRIFFLFIITILFLPLKLFPQQKIIISGLYHGLNKDYGEFIYFYNNNFYYNVNLGEFLTYVQGNYEIKNNEIICNIKEKGFGQGWAENDISQIKIIIQKNQTLKFATDYGYDISENKIFKFQKAEIKTIKVNSLRLRSNNSLKSKVIKDLKKGESVVIINVINEVTINAIKGHWVFIKTENNVFGYCFDGYLE